VLFIAIFHVVHCISQLNACIMLRRGGLHDVPVYDTDVRVFLTDAAQHALAVCLQSGPCSTKSPIKLKLLSLMLILLINLVSCWQAATEMCVSSLT
jgi:hypothetical protein